MVCQEKKISKKTIKGYGSAANFEHVRNFSDIFQSINNITMVVIGIYTLTQIISHHYVELKSTLCILYHTAHFQTDNYTQ